MSVSLNPFSRCFRTQPELTPQDLALPLLQAAGLDTPANRQKIRSEWSQKIVESLAASNLLTQPNIDKLLLGESDWLVARALAELVSAERPMPQLPQPILNQRELDTIFPNPENVPDASMALHYLHEAQLTNPIDFDIFSLGGDVAVGLGLLASKGLLTERNLDAVIAYPWMGTAFSDKMSEWDAAGMLTEDQLDEFLNTEDLDTNLQALVQECCVNIAHGRGASIEHRQCAIRVLRQSRILMPENRMDILSHPDRALFTTPIYGWLASGNILNPVNKDIVLNRLTLQECELLGGGMMLAHILYADPTQMVQLITQDLFDRLVEKPEVVVKALPLFAFLVKAGLFNPDTPEEIFSRLGNIDNLFIGVEVLSNCDSLDKDNFADLMADPRHAYEIALQIVFGFDRSAREQIAQGQATPELLAHPGYTQLKATVNMLLQTLGIANPENQAIVDKMTPRDASHVLQGLKMLQLGMLVITKTLQAAAIPSLLPTEAEAMQFCMQKGFNAIVADPEHAMEIAHLHLALQAKIPSQYHGACFTHPDNLSAIVQGLEKLGKNELFNLENLMLFLSDDQAHVSKITALLTQCRSLDQQRFERIVARVKSGETESPQSLDLDIGIQDLGVRRRLPFQDHEMKV